MTLRYMVPAVAARFASAAFVLTTVTFLLTAAGCSSDPGPAAPTAGTEVSGTLVAIKDDRPVDGGIDLTLETAPGVRETVRVPSIFIAGPRDSIQAMHEVVDAATIGDRLHARGARDESGALLAQILEKLPR